MLVIVYITICYGGEKFYNICPSDCLRDLFSPSQKSDCSSVQPGSAHSESVRSNVSSAYDLTSRFDSAKTSYPALRRLTSFDSHKMLQINVGAVEKKTLRPRAEPSVVEVKKKTGESDRNIFQRLFPLIFAIDHYCFARYFEHKINQTLVK